MRTTTKTLREVRDAVRSAILEIEQHRGKTGFDTELADDPAFQADSVYVPDHIKDKISRFMSDMGLSKRHK